MALLEERYQPGLSTKAALALALDCCRALQEGGTAAAAAASAAEEDGGGKGQEESAAAVDVALISPEGVRLVERLSPPESLLSLVEEDEEDCEGEKKEE